jgi:hypothetical protein
MKTKATAVIVNMMNVHTLLKIETDLQQVAYFLCHHNCIFLFSVFSPNYVGYLLTVYNAYNSL